MRIAYITSAYARASDTFIRNEVIELRRRGHEVHTYSLRRPERDHRVDDEVAAEQASTCYILSVPKGSLLAAISAFAATHPRAVIRALSLAMRVTPPGLRARAMHVAYVLEAIYLAVSLQRRRIEVLHNHIAENSATVAMLASDLSGIPFSMTVHGPGIFAHPRHWALGEKIARSAFTACISNFCRSQCMWHARLEDWPKLHLVRCGVGQVFEQVTPTAIPEAPRVVFVGRLCQEKGLPVLLQALRLHLDRGGGLKLVVIGDGPLMSYLQAFVTTHGLKDAVEILGWQGSAQVVAELSRSRAFVLPSFAEGLPVSIMESLALNRPVITTSIAGIPELVRSGVNGWLVAPGSVEELADALMAATSADATTLEAMGRRGAEAVRLKHSVRDEMDKLEALLAGAVLRPTSATSTTKRDANSELYA